MSFVFALCNPISDDVYIIPFFLTLSFSIWLEPRDRFYRSFLAPPAYIFLFYSAILFAIFFFKLLSPFQSLFLGYRWCPPKTVLFSAFMRLCRLDVQLLLSDLLIWLCQLTYFHHIATQQIGHARSSSLDSRNVLDPRTTAPHLHPVEAFFLYSGCYCSSDRFLAVRHTSFLLMFVRVLSVAQFHSPLEREWQAGHIVPAESFCLIEITFWLLWLFPLFIFTCTTFYFSCFLTFPLAFYLGNIWRDLCVCHFVREEPESIV